METAVISEDEREYAEVEWGITKILIGTENVGARHLRISITEYAPGVEHEMHRHPGQEEVILVLKGKGITKTKDGEKPIRPGDFVFIPADTDHATINVLKDRPMKAVIIKAPPYEQDSP